MKVRILIAIFNLTLHVTAMDLNREPSGSLIRYGAENWQQIINLSGDIQTLQDQAVTLELQEEKLRQHLLSGQKIIDIHKDLIGITNEALMRKSFAETVHLQGIYQNKVSQFQTTMPLFIKETNSLELSISPKHPDSMEIDPLFTRPLDELEWKMIASANFLYTVYPRDIMIALQKSAHQLWNHLTNENSYLEQILTLQKVKKSQIKHKRILQNQILGIVQQTCGQLNWYLTHECDQHKP